MTRRVRRGSASDGRQKRNPIAKLLQEKPFQGRAKPSRKIYQRQAKHRGRSFSGLDSLWPARIKTESDRLHLF